MSHKAGYYVGKIRKKDASACRRISDVFAIKNSGNSSEKASAESFHSSDTTESSKVAPAASSDMRTATSLRYLSKYDWLYHNAVTNTYHCKKCEVVGKSGVFSKGVKSLGDHPSRLLDSHEDGKTHKDAVGEIFAANTSMNVKCMILSSKSNRDIIKKLLMCTNFMVRQKYALSEKFEEFVRFVALLGVEDLMQHLNNAPKNATYLSAVSVNEFIGTISNYIEVRLLESLRQSDFFTLLADESTDEQGRQQLSIYARWKHEENITDHFLGLVHIAKADSASITLAIQQFFVEKGLDLSKARFFAFDGTNTMSGERSAVQRRLRHIAPHGIYLNCRCHRLALCVVHLMKKEDYKLLVDVDGLLLGLWKLFEYSPRRFTMFVNIQTAYARKPLQLVKAAATRWLSHGAACTRVSERYIELVDTLDALYDERRESEVMGLRIILLQKDVAGMILLLSDVLRIMNRLSLFLQHDNLDFSAVPHQVEKTLTELDLLMDMVENREQHPELTFSRVDEMYQEITDRTALARRQRQDDRLMNASPGDFLREKGLPFIRALKCEIEDQFVCSPLLQATRVLDPKNLPQALQDLPDYGKADMITLSEFYSLEKIDTYEGHQTVAPPDLPDGPDATYREIETFKTHMFMEKQRMERQGLEPSLVNLFKVVTDDEVMQQMFPKVTKLLHLLNLIPCGTAVVERGFSLMNNLCTTLRSSLSQNVLDNLMHVCKEGKETRDFQDDEWEAMVSNFKMSKQRRIDL